MAIPMWEMGAAAVDLAVRRVRDQPNAPIDRVVLPMRLVVRASCRPLSVRDSLATNQVSAGINSARTVGESEPTNRRGASQQCHGEDSEVSCAHTLES
jgi:hypothetical protein